MDIQSVLLGFLSRKSMTGYGLKQAFSISFSFFSGLSYGSIYPALRKLEDQKLVTMRLERQEKAPNRKVYTITEAGRRAFMEALKSPVPVEPFRSAFLMRLFFFAGLPPDERRTLARGHLDAVRGMHRTLEKAHPEIKGHADPFQYLCFQFGLRFFRDLTHNISEVVRTLDEEEECQGR